MMKLIKYDVIEVLNFRSLLSSFQEALSVNYRNYIISMSILHRYTILTSKAAGLQPPSLPLMNM